MDWYAHAILRVKNEPKLQTSVVVLAVLSYVKKENKSNNHRCRSVSILCNVVDIVELTNAWRTHLETLSSSVAYSNFLHHVFFDHNLEHPTLFAFRDCFMAWRNLNSSIFLVSIVYFSRAALTIFCNITGKRKKSGQCRKITQVRCRKF